MPTETKTTDNTVMAALLVFEKKASEVENKHLRHYAQMLAKDLDLLGKTYLREYKLTSNTSAI